MEVNDPIHAEIAELEELKLRCTQLQSKITQAGDLRKQREEERKKVAADALEEAIRTSQAATVVSERASRAREKALAAMKACLFPDGHAPVMPNIGGKRKAVGQAPGASQSTKTKKSQGATVAVSTDHLVQALGGLEDRIVKRVIDHIDKSSERLEHAKRPKVEKRPPPAKRPKIAKQPGDDDAESSSDLTELSTSDDDDDDGASRRSESKQASASDGDNGSCGQLVAEKAPALEKIRERGAGAFPQPRGIWSGPQTIIALKRTATTSRDPLAGLPRPHQTFKCLQMR